jgi:hypothetical protein
MLISKLTLKKIYYFNIFPIKKYFEEKQLLPLSNTPK